ncbi:MAG: TPM domain-containing protein [Candidatus Zixiibacteriota bacterium]
MKKVFSAILVLLAATGCLIAAEIPDYKGPINDLADILSNAEIRRLEAKALSYRQQSGSEIGVLIVPTLDGAALEDFAHDVFNKWGIGKADKDNGVLFLVAIEEKKARIEVGYGLEGALTDLEAGRLVNKNSPMAQRFREGDFAGGVGAVLDGIVQAIGGEYDPPEADDEVPPGIPLLIPIGFIIFFALLSLMRRKSSIGRRFGGPFIGGFGGFGGGFGGGGGGGGGFSFGGGSSGGGGASGGW